MSAGHAWEHLLPPELANGVGFHPLFLGLETLFFAKKLPNCLASCLGLGTRVTAAPVLALGWSRTLSLQGVPTSPGCAAGQPPQAVSTRTDVRNCSADPPVSPTMTSPTCF